MIPPGYSTCTQAIQPGDAIGHKHRPVHYWRSSGTIPSMKLTRSDHAPYTSCTSTLYIPRVGRAETLASGSLCTTAPRVRNRCAHTARLHPMPHAMADPARCDRILDICDDFVARIIGVELKGGSAKSKDSRTAL